MRLKAYVQNCYLLKISPTNNIKVVELRGSDEISEYCNIYIYMSEIVPLTVLNLEIRRETNL